MQTNEPRHLYFFSLELKLPPTIYRIVDLLCIKSHQIINFHISLVQRAVMN